MKAKEAWEKARKVHEELSRIDPDNLFTNCIDAVGDAIKNGSFIARLEDEYHEDVKVRLEQLGYKVSYSKARTPQAMGKWTIDFNNTPV